MDLRTVIRVFVCLCVYGGLLHVHGDPLTGDGAQGPGPMDTSDGIHHAQCSANCYEKFGYLPDHINAGGYNEIVDNFCKDQSCDQCLAPCTKTFISYSACLSDCMEDPECMKSCKFIWTNVLKAVSTESRPSELQTVRVTEPSVVCMNVGSGCAPGGVYLYLTWHTNVYTDITPIVYAVEARQNTDTGGGSNDWALVTMVPSTTAKIDNLSCSSMYQFQITPVSTSGILGQPVLSDWFKTFSDSDELFPPRSLQIKEQRLIGQAPSITVEWEPVKGSACNYIIYWFRGQKMWQDELKAPWRFQYNLTGLWFATNYTLKLHSAGDKFIHTSDEPRQLKLLTPECLKSTMYNHTICPPLQPRNLTYKIHHKNALNPDTKKLNISLYWKPPFGSRNGSDVTRYHITYRKEPPVFGAQYVVKHGGVLNSTSTSVLLTNIHNHNLYIFTVIAESVGGPGKPAQMSVYFGLRSVNDTEMLGSTTKDPSPYSFGVPALVAVVVAPVLLLVTSFLIVMKLVRRRRGSKRRNLPHRQLGPVEEMNPIYEGMPLFGDTGTSGKLIPDSYEIDYSCLDFISVIGEGAFGKVVKAEFYESPEDRGRKAGKIVAVKMLKEFYTRDESRNFLLEIQAMKNLGHHPYILGIIGCCLTGPKLCLVMDYCALGDLRNYLRKYREKLMYNMSSPYGMMTKTDCAFHPGSLLNSDSGVSPSTDTSDCQDEPGESEITEAQLLSYSRQITMGMEFLEQKKFIHRDLAARNILLFDKRHVKISDFGLTRDVYETNIYQPTSARKLPYKWMALESLFSQRFTIQSDVWSFGIVLWEIVTLGGSPYPSIPLKDLYGLLNDGYRMERPENCSKQVYKIMLSCWHPNPHSRPTFGQLREEIEKLLEETQSYIDLSVEVSGDYFNESTNNSHADIPARESEENDDDLNALQVTNSDLGAYLESQKLVVDIHDEPMYGQKRTGEEDAEEKLLPKQPFGVNDTEFRYPESGLYCVFRLDKNRKWSTSEQMLEKPDYQSNSCHSLHVSPGHDVKQSLKDNIKSLMEKVGIRTFVTSPRSRRRSVSLTTPPVSDCERQLRSSVTVL